MKSADLSLVLRARALRSLTAVLISGSDAKTFLQGQLTADLRKLSLERALLAACNSAQGRVQSVLTLLERDEGVLAVLPTSMAGRFVARLRSHVLRSRVIVAEQSRYTFAPLTTAQAEGLVSPLPQMPGECVNRGVLGVLRWWSADGRYLLVAPDASFEPDAQDDLAWRQADIAAGIPQVYPETHEFFLAQALNLDLLGGISFDKGCYTGQEIVARTHYRGTIKRRMMRFAAHCAVPAPGARVMRDGAHAGDVVDACPASPGTNATCEVLAVVSLDRASSGLELDGIPDSRLTRLALPYAIPQAEAA